MKFPLCFQALEKEAQQNSQNKTMSVKLPPFQFDLKKKKKNIKTVNIQLSLWHKKNLLASDTSEVAPSEVWSLSSLQKSIKGTKVEIQTERYSERSFKYGSFA